MSMVQNAENFSRIVPCVTGATSVRAVPKRARDTLRLAILLCVAVMLVEGIFGLIANSLAILSDGVHMFADVFALSISLFALHASSWGVTTKSTFGCHRAEVIGALCSVFTTWILVIWIAAGAISRSVTIIQCASNVNQPNCEGIDANIMLGVGIFGLCMNLLLALVLSLGGEHGHSHGSLSGCSIGHDHGEHAHHGHLTTDVESTVILNKSEAAFDMELVDSGAEHDHLCTHKTGNMNMRAAVLHVIGDCLQSLGVVVAAGIMSIGNNLMYDSSINEHSYYNLADPFLSILFGVLTLYTTSNLVKEVLSNLLEEVPISLDYITVHDALMNVENVRAVEDLHMWSVGPDFSVLSAHLCVDGCLGMSEAADIVKVATQRCKDMGIKHITIQLNIMSQATALTD